MTGKCASCGHRLERTTSQHAQTVARRRFVSDVEARRCRSCGSVFVQAASLERADLEVACALAERGPASGEAFRFLRKALGLRATDLADLLGVTPETVSRWENEQRPVDGATWITLGSLVLERGKRPPATFERLLALREPGRKSRISETRLARPSAARPSARPRRAKS